MKKNRPLMTMLLASMLMVTGCSNSNANTSKGNESFDSQLSSDSIDSSSEEGSESSEVVPATGFNVTFNYDSNCTVTVYTTKNYDVIDTDEHYQTRNGDTGEYCNDGEESQVNFKIVVADGYEVETVTATSGTYNKVKWPSDTEVENGYRLTKVNADTEITITTKSKEADPEGYKVQFVLEHCSVKVHVGKDVTTIDAADADGFYYTRDKDTGEYTKNSDTAQVNFTVTVEDGYEFISGVDAGAEVKASNISYITGSFNKLKNNDNGYFTITKVSSDLVITINCVSK